VDGGDDGRRFIFENKTKIRHFLLIIYILKNSEVLSFFCFNFDKFKFIFT
jgi:hypothetical protein